MKESPRQPDQPTPAAVRIAIVDDDEESRQLWADWISQTPGLACVSQSGNAHEAEANLLRDRPDIVLMDIKLPGRSGIECVRDFKQRAPDIQFVMLTVYGDADHVFEALTAGASGYLLKRTNRATLLEALREVHAGGSPMSSTVARQVVQYFQHNAAKVSAPDPLSEREREVLQLLALGRQNKEIMRELGISPSTVATHIRRIYGKLHVHSRAAAVGKFTMMGGS
ncbi:MAG: response regulator transcription factor [Verrucomicrobiota bacterium]|jgi:DNA-binding NarL/FixJ family response regulator